MSPDVVRSAQAVLFVCTSNAVRSPMAAGLLRRSHGKRLYVRSAGVFPAAADGFAIEVMNELGIDIAGHKPRSLDDLGDTNFDIIFTLTPEAHHRALELTRVQSVVVEYWPTPDPAVVEGPREAWLASYRAVRDGLARRIRALFPPIGGPTV